MRAARLFTRASALCGRGGICKSREKVYGCARHLHSYTRQATPVPVTIARASAATAFPKIRARSMSALRFRPVNAGREWDFVHQWSGVASHVSSMLHFCCGSMTRDFARAPGDKWNCYWGEDASATYTFKPEIEVRGRRVQTLPACLGLVCTVTVILHCLPLGAGGRVRDIPCRRPGARGSPCRGRAAAQVWYCHFYPVLYICSL
jgi:hypothetical protein